MRICLMIEGQEGVEWDEWLGLALACEEAGLEGLFRSDHYMSLMGKPERSAFDAWTTLAAIGVATTRIKLGTLVSPATFRHPSMLAKAVASADHISHGRVELGMGTGWNEPEHRAYGFPFPPMGTRMEMLAEQVEIVHRSWNDEGPIVFRGRHYTIEGLDARPKTFQRPHPNLIVGGLAQPRALAIAARWADEYNTTFPKLEEAGERHERTVRACEEAGRDPDSLVFSMMTGCVVASDEKELRRRARAVMEKVGITGSEDEWMAHGRERWIVGTVDQVVERLRAYEAKGVRRVMLQHLRHDDLEMVHLLGAEVAPRLA
jgi:F420-dependent oxidoreductase-like protein